MGLRNTIAGFSVLIPILVTYFLENDLVDISIINDIYDATKEWLITGIGVIGAAAFLIGASIVIMPVIGGISFIGDYLRKKKLSVSLLNTSQYPGGILYIDVKWNGPIYNGYFTADIAGYFDEYHIKSRHYNASKKQGTVARKRVDFGWKWNIPDDFTSGPCKITVKAMKTVKLLVFFWSRDYAIKEYEIEFDMADAPPSSSA